MNSTWSFSLPKFPDLTAYVPDFKSCEFPKLPTSNDFSTALEKTSVTLLFHAVPIAVATLAIVKTAKFVYTDLSQRTIQHGEKSAHGLTSGQKLVTIVFGAFVTSLATAFICERAQAFKDYHFTAIPT